MEWRGYSDEILTLRAVGLSVRRLFLGG